MISTVESQKSTRHGFVKVTWTANGDLRVKVPSDCSDETEQSLINLCRDIVKRIGPTKVTLRGKFLPETDTMITLYNDSKTFEEKVMIKDTCFPIVIEVQEDAKGFKKGTEILILHPEQIPSGVSFKVVKTDIQLLQGMTKDEINSRAYTDVLEENGPTMSSDLYRYYYKFWYPLGPEYSRDRWYEDDFD